MSGHKSTKKGSNIICRVSNVTPEMVCSYVKRMPKQKMKEDAFRDIMGKSWFQNEHQAPEQWGLYYIDGTYYYPRFDHDITIGEAEAYLYHWMRNLIVINPYTRFKKQCNKNLVESIVGQLEKNPNEHDLKTIIGKIIDSDEPFVINEIIANALNNYSRVLKVETINKDNEQFNVSLIPNYKEKLNTHYNMTKKEYFELFDSVKTTFDPNTPIQQIYYGAPGTGKSNKIEKYTNDSNRIRTTFHPDSDYSTFVGAYKPTMEETGVTVAGKKETRIAYKYVPQAFLKAYVNAWNLIEKGADSPYYLVIEEINRGNCAQIFGDLFQLLDRGDNGESKYAICPDDDIKRFLAEEFKNATNIPETIKKGEEMRLPSNLYIWATMNTSDQSLFPIDSAFKRRWDWEYMPIEKGNKEFVIEIGANKYDWWKFISIINSKIDEITGSEDKKLGYWFAKPVGDGTIISCNQFVSKVLFYLWNDVYKDYADDNRSIFRIQDGNNTKKVAFTEFFGSERDTKLYAFMKANGIEPEKSSVENTDVDTTEQQ